MRQQMGLDLRHRIHGHGDHDQEAGAAEEERHREARDQDLGQDTDDGEIGRGQPLYLGLYVGMIVFFCFFYTAIVFNPAETADNLKKYGGFVPGIRPGKNTGDYLDRILTRLTKNTIIPT